MAKKKVDSVDDKLRIVKNYVQKMTGIRNISQETRKNEYCFARMTYAIIARRYVGCDDKRIGAFINSYRTLPYHAENAFPTLPKFYHMVFNEFDPSSVGAYSFDFDIRNRLLEENSLLKKDVMILKKALDESDGNMEQIRLKIARLDQSVKNNVTERLEAIINMELKKQFNRVSA